jgi:hypothetical protein
MDLLAFLTMLHGRQADLRLLLRTLALEPDSPQRRQAVVEMQTAQRELAGEIKPLRQKIEALKKQAAGPPGAKSPPQVDEQLAKAVEGLLRVADEAGRSMLAGGDLLGAGKLEPARESQAEALVRLDQIYGAVAPLPAMLSRAIEAQQAVIERTPKTSKETAELADAAFDEQFIARWAGLLAPKAEQELKSPPAAPAAPAAKPGDAEQARKTQEAMKQALQKAIALGPKAAAAARKATELLDRQKPTEALPAQQEALKLLKEIAAALPKEPPKQDPKNQKQNQKQDQKQDQKQEKKQDDKKPAGQQPKPQKPEMSPEQAEAAIRQVRQRQQDRDRKQRELQNYLYRPRPVDKDW